MSPKIYGTFLHSFHHYTTNQRLNKQPSNNLFMSSYNHFSARFIPFLLRKVCQFS